MDLEQITQAILEGINKINENLEKQNQLLESLNTNQGN